MFASRFPLPASRPQNVRCNQLELLRRTLSASDVPSHPGQAESGMLK